MSCPQLVTDFEDGELVTLDLEGMAGWDVHHLCAWLGYSADKLIAKIEHDWLGEFLQGHDYVRLDGQLILLKPAVDQIVARGGSGLGVRLRHHIVDEVLPLLRHDRVRALLVGGAA